MSSKNFRTRQAPSPTGYLHLGTCRTILFTALMALKNDGKWFLRLEDTDRSRLNLEAVTPFFENLKKLGLIADEGVGLYPDNHRELFDLDKGKNQYKNPYNLQQKGKYGPYIQSERLKIYHQHAQNLIDKRLAYWSYITPEEKEKLRELHNLTKTPINYFKENVIRNQKFKGKNFTNIPIKEIEAETKQLFQSLNQGLSDPKKPVLMYRLQRNKKISFNDELLGNSTFDLSLEEDFVIIKSDGYPTYHFAHLIDDYLMETTLVIRGQEWFPSVPKHITMFQDYWGVYPKYLHLPVILGETGNKKMSKRDGNVNIQDYFNQGFLPEAIINYLAFLGWNPGTDKELYLSYQDFSISVDLPERMNRLLNNLSKDFDITKISKSPARFSRKKLEWFNQKYLQMLSLQEFSARSLQLKINNTLIKPHLNQGEDHTYLKSAYVWLFDEEENKLLAKLSTNSSENSLNEKYRFLGGTIQSNQELLDGLVIEVAKESQNNIKINPKNLKLLFRVNLACKNKFTQDNIEFMAKELSFYYYSYKKEQIQSLSLSTGSAGDYSWYPIEKILLSNNFFKYPLWVEFRKKNGLALTPVCPNIQQEYLAWLLDQNRASSLLDFETESACILTWKRPEVKDLCWKTQTPNQCLNNLKEIFNQIQIISKKFADKGLLTDFRNKQYNILYEINIENQNLSQNLAQVAMEWETEIKNWLFDHEKKPGEYLWPLRVALSGMLKSPSPFEILAILDINQATNRIQSILNSQ